MLITMEWECSVSTRFITPWRTISPLQTPRTNLLGWSAICRTHRTRTFLCTSLGTSLQVVMFITLVCACLLFLFFQLIILFDWIEHLWVNAYVDTYTSIIAQYARVVKAQLFGHTHRDEFKVITLLANCWTEITFWFSIGFLRELHGPSHQ